MSNWEVLLDAIDYVNDFGIDVNYIGKAKDIGSPFPFNGCAYLDDGMIDLYADHPERDADKLLATLIHEFGHIMDYRLNGRDDSELMAWVVGEMKFPKEFIPKCFQEIKSMCLDYYAEYGVY